MLQQEGGSGFHETEPLPVSLSSDLATSWPVWQEGAATFTEDSRVVFLFSDFDVSYMGMGHHLYRTEPAFRAALNRCDQLLRPLMSCSLYEVLWPTEDADTDITHTHPAMFSLQYALACLWHERGIAPDAVSGYGLGEFAAACIAGVIDLREALKLVCLRAGMQQQFPTDAWLLEVEADIEAVRPFCHRMHVSANLLALCEGRTLITGSLEALTRVEAGLKAAGIALQNDLSQGSAQMKDRVGVCFHQLFADTLFKQPRIPFLSTLTGSEVNEELTNPEYWTHQMVWPKRFDQVIETLMAEQYQIFVEVGPKPHLAKMGKNIMEGQQGLWLSSMRKGVSEDEHLRHCMEQLFKTGVPVSLPAFVNQ